jgi:hypothetical protein
MPSPHFDDGEQVVRNRMAGIVTDAITNIDKIHDNILLLRDEIHLCDDIHRLLQALHDSLEKN